MTTLTQLEESRNTAAKQQFSDTTADFLKWLQAQLKSRGWTRTEAATRSAMYHWTFEKGERRITIDGWHGTGKRGTSRWYGDLKSVFSFYDNQADGRVWPKDGRMRMIFDFNCIDGTVAEHAEHLEAIRGYIRACA